MGEMAKFPYLTGRGGTRNLYYKREVPPELRAEGRPSQIWRSLRTSDRKKAEGAYGAKHAEVEAQFDAWRREDATTPGSSAGGSPTKCPHDTVPLTPALLRRLADAHYLNVYDQDFQWRGDLWKKVHADEEAFWRGEIIKLPDDDWVEFKGAPHSYFAFLMEEPVLEEVFLYAVFRARKVKLQQLKLKYQLGDNREQEAITNALLHAKDVRLTDSDRRRLSHKLMEAEIKALEDLSAGNEAAFDRILDAQGAVESRVDLTQITKSGELMSAVVGKYLEDTSRERDWPSKTVRRKRGELREFIEIAGDKPINAYKQTDGVKFKDVQLALPVHRHKAPFNGLSLIKAAEKATKLRTAGEKIDLLNPITINDKVGTVSLFFDWARSRDDSVVNPVAGLRVQRFKNKRKGKKRHPWMIDELNRMFSAPIYTGCQSERRWQLPGDVVLTDSAKYWVPLIALFSGMRLGELIQLQTTDVKCLGGIEYFDVTPMTIGSGDGEGDDPEDEKSLKTAASRRAIPIHQTLYDLGFGNFLKRRRTSRAKRLFHDFDRAKDDGSWSKQFSKHFKRFRESINVTRPGVNFHSLRHNVEDALRNANIRKEVRDAIQGHGENGVSREYGSGYYVKTLNDALQAIRYDGLDLSHLYADPPSDDLREARSIH
jgi:integrase